MKEISRIEAEILVRASPVVNHIVLQTFNEIRIRLELADLRNCMVVYDLKSRHKKYYAVI